MDITSRVKAVQSLKADNYAVATANGVAVDTTGFDEAMVILDAGTVGASGTVNAKVQESDTSGGTYTDITGAAFTQITASNDDAIYVGRLKLGPGRKAFIRAVAVVGTAACDLGMSVVLGRSWSQPSQAPQWSV